MAEKHVPLNRDEITQLLSIDPEKLPRHIAVIPDGNGRWANSRNLERIQGHKKGIERVREIVRESRRLGIGYLTLYAFSSENWNRPTAEVRTLWDYLTTYIRDDLPELVENNIRLHVIGQTERIPDQAMEEIHKAVNETKDNKGMVLTIALSYSGRNELIGAVKRICRDAVDGKVQPEQIDDAFFESYLETAGIPDPDILIRTSGEWRLSNFLLWQLAFSEIYILPTLWPDFDVSQFHQALQDYARRERRFGRTSAQLKKSVIS